MYRAKSEGRGRYLFFQEQMNIEAIERTVLETDLQYALKRSEFELYYQPQVDVKTWRVVAAESLLRWHHPKRGILEPSKYITLAEESGLIEPIGAWVIESACAQFRDWRLAGIPIQRIAVNVSARQFLRTGFIDVVRKALANTHVDPQDLELEITESELIEDLSGANQPLAQLKSLGVKIAIDDFGTGYSALSYLQHFPVDVLKIDRSFVQNIDTSNNARAIIDSIIALARGLNKIVVAEGVEEQAHVRFLTENRCDLLQGYYFSQPLTATNFAEFARREIQHICDRRRWS
jgi:EAL domain-containing protein (putative c-di-GMP-specific phosphodiesterase class I)